MKDKSNKRSPQGPRHITAELVRSALFCIPADVDRDTWVKLAMALKAADLPSSVAFELWTEWSARCATYSENDARDTWRSIKAHGAVTVATLFGVAKDHGFRFPAAGGAATAVQKPADDQAASLAEQRKRAADEATYRERADTAARAAAEMWAQGSDGAPAGYLVRKAVAAHGTRSLPDGTLLVPMRDAAGELQNLQRIASKKPANGGPDKRFLPGGRKSGLWHVLGALDGAVVVLIGEGYGTCASLHEATSRPVVVAFDAGNLVHVAKALRELHPALPLLLCGDDDRETEARTGKNPGREKAVSAARAANSGAGQASTVFPEFPGSAIEGQTDFNDLAALAGPDAVRTQVERACAALLAGEPDAALRRRCKAPTSSTRTAIDSGPDQAGDDDDGGPPAAADGSAGDDPFGGRPDPFELDDRGVWFRGRDREGNDKPAMWLCAPLKVSARTHADDANGWGYLLEFNDPDRNPKTWAMPSAMLSGEGAEWAGRLRDMGLRMAPGTAARNLVAQYIDTRNPQDRVTCTDRVGWHGGGIYVLPSGSIGTTEGRRYVFQSDAGMEDTFRRHGELAGWQTQVAGLAVGNSRLLFALCCAFAGPMVRPAGAESGGFHLRGTSGFGKTTVQRVCASVWGRPTFMQPWRATDNSLESTAVQHCDSTLILDELGQVDPRVAGECAYLLANESEKGRSTRGGLNRKRRTWKLIFLSSGEISLADHMAEAGKRTQAGMEVRMVDIPLDAGAGLGGFEERHQFETAAELAEGVTAAAALHYGTAGRAWLEWACAQHATLPARLQVLIDRYRGEIVPEAASEQVRRVGSRFALVAAAGELAGEAGITGWQPGHAAWGVRKCFDAWLGARGHLDNGEDAAMVRQVRAWLEKNGDALLTWTHRAMDDHKAATPLRAGFKRLVDETTGKPLKIDAATAYVDRFSASDSVERRTALVEFLILPEAFRRDVCKGFNVDVGGRLLKTRGHLMHESDRLVDKQRLPGMGKVPCYHIRPSIFDELG